MFILPRFQDKVHLPKREREGERERERERERKVTLKICQINGLYQ